MSFLTAFCGKYFNPLINNDYDPHATACEKHTHNIHAFPVFLGNFHANSLPFWGNFFFFFFCLFLLVFVFIQCYCSSICHKHTHTRRFKLDDIWMCLSRVRMHIWLLENECHTQKTLLFSQTIRMLHEQSIHNIYKHIKHTSLVLATLICMHMPCSLNNIHTAPSNKMEFCLRLWILKCLQLTTLKTYITHSTHIRAGFAHTHTHKRRTLI